MQQTHNFGLKVEEDEVMLLKGFDSRKLIDQIYTIMHQRQLKFFVEKSNVENESSPVEIQPAYQSIDLYSYQ